MTVPPVVVKNTVIVYVRLAFAELVAVPLADQPPAVFVHEVMVTFLRAEGLFGTSVGAASSWLTPGGRPSA